jgi:hypothetical protein
MNTTIAIFLTIFSILVILNILQVLNMNRCSAKRSIKESPIKEELVNVNSVSTLHADNREHADYQELASYVQKTNHRDFMYKDMTMAIPSDFNICGGTAL